MENTEQQPPTVQMRIAIEISQDDVIDTGKTVEEWNALTGRERWDIYRDQWDRMATRDDGSVSVIPPDAEPI